MASSPVRIIGRAGSIDFMQFAFPINQLPLWAACGAGLAAAVFLALRLLEKKREQRLYAFVEASLAERMMPAYSPRVRKPLFWLFFLGILLLAFSAAQPRWGKKWAPVTRTSRDILVVLDVSLSMAAENPPPTRLDRARQKIESLLEKCPADRFGLVAFAGEAAALCPLTLDHGYFRSILDAINTDTLSIEGSDITAALKESLETFEEDAKRFGDNEVNERVAVVISDGEQTSGDAIETAKRISNYAKVYVLGIGDPKGAVVTFPAWMRQYMRVADDKLTHLSKLDEDTLSKVAVEGGGAYVRITPDNADIDFIHNELEQFRGRIATGNLRFQLVNRYRWPLAAALACFAAEGFWLSALPWIRRRRLARLEARAHV